MGNIFSIQCGYALAGRCRDCIKKRSQYISQLEDNLVALEAAKDGLVDLKNELRQTTIIRRRLHMEQPHQVTGWASRADLAIAEVSQLLTRGARERQSLCMAGYCSYNCMSTYTFGKSVAQSVVRVNALMAEADLNGVVVNAPAKQLESGLRELRNAKSDLQAWKKVRLRRISSEEGLGKQTLEEVIEWLSEAETLLTKADQLLELDGPRELKKLLKGDESNSIFARKISQHIDNIRSLHSHGDFSQVTTKTPPQHVVGRNERPAMGDQGMLGKAWSLLHKVEVGIIGIYGIEGVGKTTLMTKINNTFATIPNDFDVVIWVVVSQDLKLDKIQESIWESIRTLDEGWLQKSLRKKAQDIFDVLQGKKFVLLLDDVWQQFHLEEIGVPIPTQQNGSKVILTTCSLAVCRQMKATETIIVKPLNREEAWKLFEENAGQIEEDILDVAQTVAEECLGLPLALTVIGRAMASRTTYEWEDALHILRGSVSEDIQNKIYQDMEGYVYNRVQFSYDYFLPNDTIRCCFVYCSLFPEEFQILEDDLVHFWHSEKLCSLREGYEILSTLVRQGLLEEKRKYVKLHAVSRDMARWMCKCEKERYMFFIKAGIRLTQLPGNEEWEGAFKVSFMENSLRSTVRISRYCDTETLFLSHNKELKIVSEGLFQCMTRMTVLDLSQANIVMLPPNIIALQSLEYLNLSYTKLEILPIQMKSLVRLKYLNLEFSKCLKMIPVGVISNLTELRALYMLECGPPFYEGEEYNALSDGNMLMKELMCLKNLCELTMTVRSASFFHGICCNQILLNSTRALHLSFLFGTKSLNISSLVHARQLNLLEISLTCDLEELVVELSKTDAPGCSLSSNLLVFRGLCEVKILDNMYLRHVTWLVFAPHLTVLTVKRNERMEEIISAEKLSELQATDAHLTPFAKLQRLELDNLPVLKTISLKSLPFSCLTRISVRECRALKKLPLNSESAGGGNVVIKAEESWWSELTWEDDQTRAAFSSCFQNSDSS